MIRKLKTEYIILTFYTHLLKHKQVFQRFSCLDLEKNKNKYDIKKRATILLIYSLLFQ